MEVGDKPKGLQLLSYTVASLFKSTHPWHPTPFSETTAVPRFNI